MIISLHYLPNYMFLKIFLLTEYVGKIDHVTKPSKLSLEARLVVKNVFDYV